jgi:hypothetical protein
VELGEFLQSPLRRAANISWEGKQIWKHRRKVVAAASADLATTIPVPLVWRRKTERRHLPVSLYEIDDYIGQAFPKIITVCRTEVAARFASDPIDAVLVAARAIEIAVDGRHASNVVGFVGSEISVLLELTFVRRELFDHFHSFFSSPEHFFFIESPQASLRLMSLVRNLPINLVVPGEDKSGSLFVFQKAKEKYPVLYREKFSWSFEPIFDAIRAEFSVSRAAAVDMYRAFIQNEVSPDAQRVLKALIVPHTESFETALRKAKVRGSTFIDAPQPLFNEMPHHIGNATIEPLPLADLLKKFDLSLEPGVLADQENVIFRHLAPFLLMYFDRAHGALDDQLRRKVHWLAG